MSRAGSPWSAGWRHTWSCIAISSRSGAPSCGLSERAKASMCGIAGALALRDGAWVDRERLCAMAGLMGHRGPDGEGFWTDPRGRVAFAHRRLSIIDIAGGRQPMCSDDGRIALVRSEEHTSELQSQSNLVCRLLLEKKKKPGVVPRCGGRVSKSCIEQAAYPRSGRCV